MKKLLKLTTLLALMLSSFPMFGQAPIYRKTLHQANESYFAVVKTLEMPDQGYLMLADAGSPTGDGIALVRTDRAGVVQWSKFYTADSLLYAADIVPLGTTGFLVCGDVIKRPRVDFLSDMFYFRIDLQGNVVPNSGFQYGDNEDDELTYTATRVGNQVLIGGTSYSSPISSNAFNSGFMVFIDSTGNADDWRNVNSNVGAAFNGFFSSDRMPDGGAILGGYTARGFTFDPYFVRLNADGSTRWVKRMNGLPGAQLGTFVKALPDGGFVATSTSTGLGTKDNAFAARFSATGGLVWYKQLQSLTFNRPYDITVAADSAVVVYGGYNISANPDASKYSPFMTKLNLRDGALRWTKTYGDTVFAERPRQLLFNKDNSYLAISEKVVISGTDTILGTQLLRTDFQGNLPSCNARAYSVALASTQTFVDSTNYIETAGGRILPLQIRSTAMPLSPTALCTATPTESLVVNSKFSIYPNPAHLSDRLVIEPDSELTNGTGILELVDMTGKVVFTKSVEISYRRGYVDTPPVSTGLYVAKFQFDGKTSISKLFIQP